MRENCTRTIAGALRRLRDQLGAGKRGAHDILGLDATLEVVPPRKKRIDPRHHAVCVSPQSLDAELAMPAIVGRGVHARFVPARFGLVAPAQKAHERIVAIGEAIGGDRNALALHALDREATVIDRRRDGFDHRPDAPFGGEPRVVGARPQLGIAAGL